mmetsp:Transcript_10596/g.25846  ORF Transcript_10596/g.25846 Transcript_10596/m.25846 type:complete len:385 (-) Transcript_10596:319-1473(-)
MSATCDFALRNESRTFCAEPSTVASSAPIRFILSFKSLTLSRTCAQLSFMSSRETSRSFGSRRGARAISSCCFVCVCCISFPSSTAEVEEEEVPGGALVSTCSVGVVVVSCTCSAAAAAAESSAACRSDSFLEKSRTRCCSEFTRALRCASVSGSSKSSARVASSKWRQRASSFGSSGWCSSGRSSGGCSSVVASVVFVSPSWWSEVDVLELKGSAAVSTGSFGLRLSCPSFVLSLEVLEEEALLSSRALLISRSTSASKLSADFSASKFGMRATSTADDPDGGLSGLTTSATGGSPTTLSRSFATEARAAAFSAEGAGHRCAAADTGSSGGLSPRLAAPCSRKDSPPTSAEDAESFTRARRASLVLFNDDVGVALLAASAAPA